MTANAWNARYPVGTVVDYFPVRGEDRCVRTTTRTPAWELAMTGRRGHDGSAILVSVEGRTGGVHVAHCWPVLPTP